MKDMITKDFGFEVKEVGDAGTFTGYGSTFNGTPDAYGEIVAPGAFAKSLKQHLKEKTMPFMLWQHDPWQPIGVWESMEEDDKGLKVAGRLLTELNQGREAHILLREKAIRGLSIGFREKKVTEADAENGTPRTLNEVDLIEVSVVTRPANRRAIVTAVKSEEHELIGARAMEIMKAMRDGEPVPIKDFEKFLRDAGLPKSIAVKVASHGYRDAIQSDSGGHEAETKLNEAVERLSRAFDNFKLPTL